jgi:hypothetical protein
VELGGRPFWKKISRYLCSCCAGEFPELLSHLLYHTRQAAVFHASVEPLMNGVCFNFCINDLHHSRNLENLTNTNLLKTDIPPSLSFFLATTSLDSSLRTASEQGSSLPGQNTFIYGSYLPGWASYATRGRPENTGGFTDLQMVLEVNTKKTWTCRGARLTVAQTMVISVYRDFGLPAGRRRF